MSCKLEKVKLGDLCTKASSNIKQSDLTANNGDYPIYGASGYIKKVDFYKQENPYIAIVKDGAGVGRVMKLPEKSSVIGTMQYIIPNSDVDVSYLAYAMESLNLAKYSNGATIPHIYFKDYSKELLPAYPLSEQHKIAAILDKVTHLINLHKKQLEKLDLLIKSRFVETFGDQKINPFGWEQSTIGTCCTLKSGTSLPVDKENEGGTIPYVKVGDMNYSGNEYYITTSSRFVSEQTAGSGIFPVGTVIFPKRGGAIKTNKKRLTSLPICADLNVMGVTAKEQLLPHYLMTYFHMLDLGTLDNGSSVPQINNKDIEPLLICLPPLSLQTEFADFVKSTDKTKKSVQKSLDKLEILKKSLMQKYFS